MEGSIGSRLRRAREQRQLSLDEVAEVTRLRLHYLQALENDDLSAMPSTAQARGFLRIYADYLGLEIGDFSEGADRPTAPPSAESGVAGSSDGGTQPPSAASPFDLRRRLPFGRAKAADAPDTDGVAGREASGSSAETDESQSGIRAADGASMASEAESLGGPRESPSASVQSTSVATPAGEAATEGYGVGSPPEAAPAAALAEPEETPLPPRSGGIGSRIARFRLGALFGRRADTPKDSSTPEAARAASVEPDTRPVHPQDAAQPSDEPAAAQESSDEIFAHIGRQLHERRELLGLTEDEVERHSRVKASFVRLLERGELEGLPSPVQTRGILASYAGFLDLDVDATLLRFAEGLQARHREQRPEPQSARARSSLTVHTSVPPLRTFIASDLVFGVGVALLLALFAAWGITRVMATRSTEEANATSPSISDVLAGTAISTVAAEVTLIPAQDTPAAATDQVSTPEGTEAATLDPNVTLQLNLATSERTYLRVTVDGEVKFDGRTLPGTDYAYQGANRIELLAGNASALRVTFNGRDLGLMGGFGEVVDRIYTAEGVSTPTSTPPPTPTPSPNITATPSVTPTPTSSPSPTPTSGG